MKKTLWVLAGLSAVAVIAGAIVGFLTLRPGWTQEPEWLLVSAQRNEKWDLWLVRADGKEEVNLTKGRGSVGRGLFSPDGKTIVFDANFGEGWRIYTMSPDGSNIARVTDSSLGYAYHRFPTMAPDGTIAFQCTNAAKGGVINICSVSPDGNHLTLLAEKSLYPYFSRDGKRIVFYSNRDGNAEVYVMNADGTDQRRLTNNPAIDAVPQFSPDGSEIIFESSRDAPKEPKEWSTIGKIYVMKADGSNVRRLTPEVQRKEVVDFCRPKPGYTGSFIRPALSPDAKRYAYIGMGAKPTPRGGANCIPMQLLISDRDGNNIVQVTDWTDATVTLPSFAPAGFRR